MATAVAESRKAALPPLLSTTDVANLIGISRVTIWRLEKSGSFPKAIVFGGVKRWQRDDITAFLEAHRAA